MLNRATLENVMDKVIEAARKAIIKNLEGDLAMVAFLLNEDGKVFKLINLLPIGDIPDKVTADAVKDMIDKFDAHGFVVQAQKMFLMFDMDTNEMSEQGECFILSAGSASEFVMRAYRVVRTKKKITALELLDLSDAHTLGNPFKGLMEQPQTIH